MRHRIEEIIIAIIIGTAITFLAKSLELAFLAYVTEVSSVIGTSGGVAKYLWGKM